MNYPEEMCAPMRADLTSVGFVELKTSEAVSELLDQKEGTVLLIVNSVCGCAAGNARPAVKIATGFEKKANARVLIFENEFCRVKNSFFNFEIVAKSSKNVIDL